MSPVSREPQIQEIGSAATDRPVETNDWLQANETYLDLWMRYLRLLVQRRIVWLRSRGRGDPLEGYRSVVISEAEVDRLSIGEGRQAEIDFYDRASELEDLRELLQGVRKEIQAQSGRMVDAGAPPALEILGDLFRLSPFERFVLVLCMAPEIDTGFSRLYGYLQDDLNRCFPTALLATALHPEPGDERPNSSFQLVAPLRRFLLVRQGDPAASGSPLAAGPLRLPSRIADFIQGFDRPDQRLEGMLRPVAEPLLAPSHLSLAQRTADWLGSQAGHGNWPVLNLTGAAGVGKRAVAAAVCERLGLCLHEVVLTKLSTRAGDPDTVPRLEREAILTQTGLYVELPDSTARDQAFEQLAEDLAERLAAPLVLAAERPLTLTRRALAIEVGKPDAQDQKHMWLQALNGDGLPALSQIACLVQQFDFGPRAILKAAEAARTLAELDPGAGTGPTVTVNGPHLWQACRERSRERIDDLAQRITSCYRWDDIVLPPDTLAQLSEIADQVASRHRVYEAWGFGAKLSRGRSITALFSGTSGCGKTMAAEILANHLNLDLFRIDLAGVVSKYIGETERNLKRIFDAAERSGAILFFDEADALFGKRTEVRDSHDRYANIEIDYLLQRMEDYDRGLAILSTNRKSDIDRSFLRRLRFLVDFPFPEREIRRRIWRQIMPRQAPVADLDLERLSRLEIPGGNIRNIAVNGAFLAAAQDRPISMRHLIHAARREYVKCDKSITEAEFGRDYPGGTR